MSWSSRYLIPPDTSSLKSCRNLKPELQLQGYGRQILKHRKSNRNDLCSSPTCSSALPCPWGRSVRAVSCWRMGAGSKSGCPGVGYGTRRSVLPQQPWWWGRVCCITRKSLGRAGRKSLGWAKERQPRSSRLLVQAAMERGVPSETELPFRAPGWPRVTWLRLPCHTEPLVSSQHVQARV